MREDFLRSLSPIAMDQIDMARADVISGMATPRQGKNQGIIATAPMIKENHPHGSSLEYLSISAPRVHVESGSKMKNATEKKKCVTPEVSGKRPIPLNIPPVSIRRILPIILRIPPRRRYLTPSVNTIVRTPLDISPELNTTAARSLTPRSLRALPNQLNHGEKEIAKKIKAKERRGETTPQIPETNMTLSDSSFGISRSPMIAD